MSGYTPLFDSLTRGTLCGRWPDIGLWPIILSLADKNGVVDVTPLYIAGITGLAEQEVIACMDRFCQPDPYSRSQDHEGRRLVLLDDHRTWGWQIVNHGKYKEKARLMAKNAREVESGREAERKRHSRLSAGVRRCPPVSDPSNANANANAKDTTAAPRPAREEVFERNFEEFKQAYPKRAGNQPWQRARKAIKARGQEGHPLADMIAGAARYARYCEATNKTGTELVMQAATFCGPDKPFLQTWEPPSAPTNGTGRRKLRYEEVMEQLGDDD